MCMVRNKEKITIELFPKTRERMLRLAKKKEAYDDYINRAIDALEGKGT
jgi:hypothetical protein